VTDGLSVTGMFELDGAIVQPFREAQGEYLDIGDAVTVVADGAVGMAYADMPEFKPAIGIVVGFAGDMDIASTTQLRTAKVAIGGVVGGFEGLSAGLRYFLSDITSYSERQEATSTLPGLIPGTPGIDGAAIQVVGLAKSSSELIINPSFDWRIVGEDNAETGAPIYVNQYNVENIIIDSGNDDDEQDNGGTGSTTTPETTDVMPTDVDTGDIIGDEPAQEEQVDPAPTPGNADPAPETVTDEPQPEVVPAAENEPVAQEPEFPRPRL
jgi:hypothetical protein